MAGIIKRRLLSLGSPSTVVASFLGRLLTTRGDIIRRGSSSVERLALGSTGAPVGSDGTDFDYLTQAELRTFFGYETGTFTPTMAFATPGTSSWAYTTQTGVYVKIGRLVWVHILVQATPTIGTGSGIVTVEGFPFASDIFSVLPVGSLNNDWTWPASRTDVFGAILSGTTQMRIQAQGTAADASTFAASNMATGNVHDIRITGAYRAAS